MELVSKKLNLANRMDQITCLQPKELVTVGFLKNLYVLFLDSTMSIRFGLNSLKENTSFLFPPRRLSGQDF